MVTLALEAASVLQEEGVSVEVVDPRTLAPLDTDTIVTSVEKTSRLVVLDEAFSPCGVGAEIAAIAADKAFFYLDSPLRRIHTKSIPHPTSPSLEKAILPDLDEVIRVIRDSVAP
jgi:pyruvate/2-oxoglutarate/acetoin dehydrogenase E1 component